MGKKSDKPSNVATHIHFETGNVDEAFAKADVVIEREFKTASVHQGYIEPHVSTALWNQDGHLTIWTSTQGSFTARQQTAELLQIPVSQVTVVPCEIGGGFGGKIAVFRVKKVWLKSASDFGMFHLLATSKNPPMPTVVLVRKRTDSSPAPCQRPCRTLLMRRPG